MEQGERGEDFVSSIEIENVSHQMVMDEHENDTIFSKDCVRNESIEGEQPRVHVSPRYNQKDADLKNSKLN